MFENLFKTDMGKKPSASKPNMFSGLFADKAVPAEDAKLELQVGLAPDLKGVIVADNANKTEQQISREDLSDEGKKVYQELLNDLSKYQAKEIKEITKGTTVVGQLKQFFGKIDEFLSRPATSEKERIAKEKATEEGKMIGPLVAYKEPFEEGLPGVIKTVQEEIARSGASLALTYENIARFLTGQETIDQVDISGTGFERKLLRAIFGDRPLESIEYRLARAEITSEKLGDEIEKTGKINLLGESFNIPKQLGSALKTEWDKGNIKINPIATLAIGAIIGLDFTGVGGTTKGLKLLTKVNKVDDAANILRRMGVADDLVTEYAPIVAKTSKIGEMEKVVNRLDEIIKTTKEVKSKNLPALIQGETFVLGETGQIVKATKKEAEVALKAEMKAAKLSAKEQKIRQSAIKNINIQRGNTDRITETLKNKGLLDDDISNIVLEDGTKLVDTVKVKRNADKTLSTVIRKSEIDDIARRYTDEIPMEKWTEKSILADGVEIPIKAARSIELPYAWFERKGLSMLYDPIVKAGRDAESQLQLFVKRFEDAGLYKKGGWFTANRFDLSKSEAESIGKYYLSRQGKGYNVALNDLSPRSQKFVEIFDGIIRETEPKFFSLAKKMGKIPGKVDNYAPIMTRDDIQLIDKGGAMDWLFRKHPAFFSLKERAKKVPESVYETDYRRVANGWLSGITDFLNYGETTNHLKYLIESDQLKGLLKEQDYQYVSRWLRDITTFEAPSSMGGQAIYSLSKLLRKGVALGSLGLNYASVVKQALTQLPLTIIEKAPPKLYSKYAKAFGINVTDMPAITKRVGDIAIKDLQGKVGRVFTGPLTKFDKMNAQASLNALLDKEYFKLLKEGVEITPEARTLLEKRAMDALDMWYGGFFKGQRPEAFRKELGNFILMFLYPLTSQLNGFYRSIATARGLGETAKASAEVLATATAIAYLEQTIENLSPQWSDEMGMTRDVLISLLGNVPVAGNIAYSIANETEFQVSPSLGNLSKIMQNIGKDEEGKVAWTVAETFGLPKVVRRIKEGMEIMEAGGITDDNGKMLAPVSDTIEIVRSFLRGKYGSIAAQDWVRNIGVKSEDRRWFVPEVEFLQNGDYERKAELYRQFDRETKKQLYDFLSEGQQEKLDKELEGSWSW